MPLLNAFEDLTLRSLAHLPSLWEKLRFLSELLTDTGYRHWGLEQKYGSDPAQAAMAAAHASVVEEFASARLPDLWMSVSQAAYREQVDVTRYLVDLETSSSAPPDGEGVPAEHYEFVLTNLSRVAQARATTH